MADPVLEQTSTTTTKATTEAGAAAVLAPPATPQADDNIRKVLAIAVLVQFLALVGYMMWLGKKIDDTQMILGAEIGFVSMVLNFYFGSSSGSAAKSALLAKDGKGA